MQTDNASLTLWTLSPLYVILSFYHADIESKCIKLSLLVSEYS
jgi:hypothetical protein